MHGGFNVSFPTLQTRRLQLRQIVISDAERLFPIFSDMELMEPYDYEPVANLGEMRSVVQQYSEWLREPDLRWGIAFKSDPDNLIGICEMHSWDKALESATLGYVLSRHHWRQGITREAIQALLDYGFLRLGLTKIRATVLASNVGSAKLLEGLAFRSDGMSDERSGFTNYVLSFDEWKR
jgi:[ribosomal protein S5]-alanine N-acetyltransferase